MSITINHQTSDISAVLKLNGTPISSGAAAGEFSAIATGTISSANLAIVLNSDGTVSAVAETGGTSLTAPVAYNATNTSVLFAHYDYLSKQVVVAYNTTSAFIVLGTYSDNTITFGTPVSCPGTTAFAASANKIYVSNGSGIFVGNISTGQVTFGSINNLSNIYAMAVSNSGKLFLFSPNLCYIGTPSGSSISFSSGVDFSGGYASWGGNVAEYDALTDVCLYSWFGTGSYTYIRSISISGSSTPVVNNLVILNSNGVLGGNTPTLLKSNGNGTFVLAASREYAYNVNYALYAFALTVSGTTVTAGTGLLLSTSTGINRAIYLNYDGTSMDFMLGYRTESGNSVVKTLAISGLTVTASNEYIIGTAAAAPKGSSFWHQEAASSRIFTVDSSGYLIYLTKLNSSSNKANFIGFSKAAADSGNSVTIKTNGSVVTGLSGLTPNKLYYVNNIGELTLTSTGNPVVGTSLSSTSLLINCR